MHPSTPQYNDRLAAITGVVKVISQKLTETGERMQDLAGSWNDETLSKQLAWQTVQYRQQSYDDVMTQHCRTI